MASMVPVLRLAVMGVVSVFALIVMAMCADLIHFTNKFVAHNSYFTFSALGLATSLLTLFSLPAMIIIDRLRRGAITSLIVVELGVLGLLWVLWLATAALTANNNGTGGNCNFGINVIKTACGEINAVEAFAFLNWLAIMAYIVVLFVFSIMAANRGNSGVWTSSVKDTDFGAPASGPMHNHGEKNAHMAQPQGQSYPPQPNFAGQPAVAPQPSQSPYPQV